jgi:CheY-like chemotaxis protein
MQESQRLESLGTLAGGVAHDFNNLLTVILGNTQLTLEDLGAHAPPPLRKKIERIRIAAETAARLTGQMLTYAGKGTVELSPQDLSALVVEMRDLLQASQGGRGTLELRLADDLPPVQADPTQMQQVILNLVTNAFEALESAAGSVRVSTHTLEADADSLADCFGVADPALGCYVTLEVCDTGAGVDPSDRARLFEPFFTTKFSGRGLGLPSVLGIVRAHGGAIQVDETPGGGTTFRILLPAAERGADPRAGNPGPMGTAGRERTILVVDDEESVLDVAEAFLQRAGFEVITARGGQKGLEVLRARSDEIGAVLLDLAMPELNGEETFAAMRRIRPELPVVLVSGFSEEMAAERFPHEGLAGFLHKPYRPEVLAARVRAALALTEERD